MTMDQTLSQGSDPKAAFPVAQQFVRIELAHTGQRIRFRPAIHELSESAPHRQPERAIVPFDQIRDFRERG